MKFLKVRDPETTLAAVSVWGFMLLKAACYATVLAACVKYLLS